MNIFDDLDSAVAGLRRAFAEKDRMNEGERYLFRTAANSVDKLYAENSRLRAELSAKDERLKDAERLLVRTLSRCCGHGEACTLVWHREIAVFLGVIPELSTPEKSHESPGCPECCHPDRPNRQFFGAHKICEDCRVERIQAMLGAPVKPSGKVWDGRPFQSMDDDF